MAESDRRVGSALFRRWAELITSHRPAALAAIAIVTALAVYQIKSKLYVDNSPEAFMDSDGDAARVLEDFRDVFGRDDVFLLLIEGDVFSEQYLDKLARLHAELEGLNVEVESLGERKSDRDSRRGRKRAPHTAKAPATDAAAAEAETAAESDADMDADFADMEDDESFDEPEPADGASGSGEEEESGSIVDEVISLINVRKIRPTSDGISVGDLMDPMPKTAEERAAIRDEVLGNADKGIPADATLVGQVVGAEGRHSALIVRMAFMSQPDTIKVFDAVVELIGDYDDDEFRIHLGGMPPLVASMQRMMLKDIRVLIIISLLVIGGILLFMFVHPMGAIVPLMVVAVSGLWSLGAMASLEIPMTVITNILPSFIICVGVADSVHLMSVYRQARLQGMESREAAIHATADTGIPIFFTTTTTAVGLLSFQFAQVDAIGEMGLIGAFGVFVAFFNTVTLLPVMLSFNKTSMLGADKTKRMGAISSFLNLCAGLSGKTPRRRNTTLVVAAGLTVVAFYGISLIYVWHDPLSWMPEGTPIKVAMATADENLGGTANVQLFIEATGPNGVKDIELIKGVEQLEQHIREFVHPKLKLKIVGNTRGIVAMIRETNRALLGGDYEHYRVPDTQRAVNDRFVMVENSGPADLKRLITLDAQVTQVTIGMKWLEATSYLPLADYIAEGVEEFIPPDKAKVSMTGSVYNFLSTVATLLFDMLRSFGVAFSVITLLMIMLLRDIKLGLVAMVPNLVPIVFILGAMGFFDIPIDMANLMIASIALGIAVDDTIHLLHHFKVHYDIHGDVEEAIDHSLAHTGRALTVTSLILAAGFMVYLSSVMFSLQRFGVLIGSTVIIALLLDLIVTPALLRTLYQKKPAAA